MSSLGEHLSKNMTKTLNLQKTCRHHLKKKLKNLKRGRSLMVVSVIDEKVQKFMLLLYKKAGHISRSIAAATAIVLISRTDEKSVYNMFVTSTQGRSLLQTIGTWVRFLMEVMATDHLISSRCYVNSAFYPFEVGK